jgi:hypothetical protein
MRKALPILALSTMLISCRSSEQQYEEVQLPTQGLITIVKEVEKDQFKIDDEVTIPDTASSLIIAKYLDKTVDTFTLQEARLMEAQGHHRSGIARAASMGLMGYMMGRSMSAFTPSPGAYTSPERHAAVASSSGNTMRSTASRVTRPVGGSSGFGSGRSTRSVGG